MAKLLRKRHIPPDIWLYLEEAYEPSLTHLWRVWIATEGLRRGSASFYFDRRYHAEFFYGVWRPWTPMRPRFIGPITEEQEHGRTT